MYQELKLFIDHLEQFCECDYNLKQEIYSYHIKEFNLNLRIICSTVTELLKDFITEEC